MRKDYISEAELSPFSKAWMPYRLNFDSINGGIQEGINDEKNPI